MQFEYAGVCVAVVQLSCLNLKFEKNFLIAAETTSQIKFHMDT